MNSPVTILQIGDSLPEGVGRRRWTSDEVLQMVRAGILGEDERIELVGGEIITMSPKGVRHENLRSELAHFWSRQRQDDVKVVAETTLRLSPTDAPVPDIILFPATMLASDVRGETVLLVVEVADTSLAYDSRIKAPLYAAFGVREYWVIDARTLVTTVHRDPAAAGYGTVIEAAADATLTPMAAPALAVRLADIRLD